MIDFANTEQASNFNRSTADTNDMTAQQPEKKGARGKGAEGQFNRIKRCPRECRRKYQELYRCIFATNKMESTVRAVPSARPFSR
ncbi:MAG: hypothetical protein ACJAVO_001363 [Parvibaculaceae bacterium]|jgi:hypothetical protein